ncbi:MAG: hypothetical protein COV34_02385 [Candidatus Zambryskibacteria bacterium CG10_big_fil_rev_8_21_14_0_10_42_12]|uniref:Primosomal protein N' 3' DNA-binding domain-containing protein n=1 Tax=Candidatus Zambryskibacteria bacterium CG10_big_fil_rev_8_21_14_0_10_42_12 TaxID=1975115 RepID=A0A2H0QUG1_9BACT|nr:MAG: hypothetical protein COV34_02385 [Candidatus Zambryskibacteria bacterium CG10_big_fil_rev_8_21_14_0_10_42_12]
MYIVRVIPVVKNISKEELSYFSTEKYDPGSVVKVPLRNKKVYGIVRGSENAKKMKAEVRDAPFEMRRLPARTTHKQIWSKAFTEAALHASSYFAHPLGVILNAIIPQKIFDHIKDIPESSIKPRKDNALPEKLAFQEGNERRSDHYRALVRESFARGESVFILVSNKTDGARLRADLSKGIEMYLVDFSRTLSQKDMVALYAKAREESHPMFIIGTSKFLSVDRNDVGTIIIERESSRAYKMLGRPYLDGRMWAEIYASKTGARIIYADSLLRVETIGRLDRNELQEHAQLKRRIELPTIVELVDMREKTTGIVRDLPALSETMRTTILTAHDAHEKVVIISARKGLSPATYCKDCGTMVACSICNAGMILHAGKKENFFLCHKCGERRSAQETCVKCDSWNLQAYGTGIEKVEKELKELLPSEGYVRLDKDTAPTLLRARDLFSQWQKHATVLLGTERILSFIDEAHMEVRATGIAGIDALFAIPDFRMYEKIFALIVHVASFTKDTLIIDTRNPEHPLFSAVVRNDLMSFYREELSLRKTLSYPPESVFIKVSLSGQKDEVLSELEDLKHTLDYQDGDIVIFPALVKKNKLYTMHMLIKVPWDKWPDEDLSQKLAHLPLKYSVKVDPDSLLS